LEEKGREREEKRRGRERGGEVEREGGGGKQIVST
jgi:hypothetical protein